MKIEFKAVADLRKRMETVFQLNTECHWTFGDKRELLCSVVDSLLTGTVVFMFREPEFKIIDTTPQDGTFDTNRYGQNGIGRRFTFNRRSWLTLLGVLTAMEKAKLEARRLERIQKLEKRLADLKLASTGPAEQCSHGLLGCLRHNTVTQRPRSHRPGFSAREGNVGGLDSLDARGAMAMGSLGQHAKDEPMPSATRVTVSALNEALDASLTHLRQQETALKSLGPPGSAMDARTATKTTHRKRQKRKETLLSGDPCTTLGSGKLMPKGTGDRVKESSSDGAVSQCATQKNMKAERSRCSKGKKQSRSTPLPIAPNGANSAPMGVLPTDTAPNSGGTLCDLHRVPALFSAIGSGDTSLHRVPETTGFLQKKETKKKGSRHGGNSKALNKVSGGQKRRTGAHQITSTVWFHIDWVQDGTPSGLAKRITIGVNDETCTECFVETLQTSLYAGVFKMYAEILPTDWSYKVVIRAPQQFDMMCKEVCEVKDTIVLEITSDLQFRCRADGARTDYRLTWAKHSVEEGAVTQVFAEHHTMEDSGKLPTHQHSQTGFQQTYSLRFLRYTTRFHTAIQNLVLFFPRDPKDQLYMFGETNRRYIWAAHVKAESP